MVVDADDTCGLGTAGVDRTGNGAKIRVSGIARRAETTSSREFSSKSNPQPLFRASEKVPGDRGAVFKGDTRSSTVPSKSLCEATHAKD